MKNILFVISLLLVSQASFADESSKKFNVKYGANGGGFGFGPAIEFKVHKNITVGVLYETISLNAADVDASSAGYGLNARYYFTEALTQDVYIQASYVTGNAEASDNFSSVDADVSSANLTLGKTWMWDNFNLDGSIGARSMSLGTINNANNIDVSSIEELDGFGASISFTIGYAF